jgi:DNA-binding NarL/FixJ family response regulator
MTRILICDDHPLVRRGLRDIVTTECRARHVAEASTAQEALDEVRRHPWDLVLLDVSLPGRSGLEVVKDMRRERPGLRVLMVSMFPEDQYALRTLRAGASGYLNKAAAPAELAAAVQAILAGRKYVTARTAERLIDEVEGPARRHDHETLSDREFEITCLIAAGKTLKEIAAQLGLSVKTVSTYRARSLRKLHVKNTADVIRYALAHQLVPS